MKKQVVEKYFKESIEKAGVGVIDKIQVNPFSYTPTIADYFVQTNIFDVMVECKEVKTGIFNTSRVIQEFKLNEFESRFKRNKGFLFIVFWSGTIKKSHAYLIPIKDWIAFRKSYGLVTIKFMPFDHRLSKYLCPYNETLGIWNIKFDRYC